MPLQGLRSIVSRYPVHVIVGWLVATAIVALTAPDLTRLAAEGQARLAPANAESERAKELLKRVWPDQWSESTVALALERESGLTDADSEYAAALADRLRGAVPAGVLLRVLGPKSQPEIAERLRSNDGKVQLLLAALSTSFVAPNTHETVQKLRDAAAGLPAPEGLKVRWSGDAVVGRDYMRDVQVSLDRAAIATVFLLLGVLLFVYRSPFLAAIPLITIGVGLLVSRAALGWLARVGWEVSPLVELFLIVVLFGCGTDFCLFLSWRFGEHWNATNPAGAMRQTLKSALEPIATSAGTVIVGMTLMGTTQFKLFSSTGPSVALGLGITLIACLTLTPALLVLLAKWRPRSFAWLTRPSGGVWDEVGKAVLKWPGWIWAATLAAMLPLAIIGAHTHFVQDLLSEMPDENESVRTLNMIAERFGPGAIAPLAFVVESPTDLSGSEGLALIDDLSRLLTRQRHLAEVRSATQPLGSSKPLEPARLASRLAAVNEGFAKLSAGAGQLRQGLIEGAAKLKTALQIKQFTGIDLTGTPQETGSSLARGLAQASTAILGRRAPATPPDAPADSTAQETKSADKKKDPRELMLGEILRAAEGAGQIVEGAERASREVTAILNDPVGRRALDRLLVTAATVAENPELRRSFQTYISPDGRFTRIDIVQSDRLFSTEAMKQVTGLRQRIRSILDEQDEVPITQYALAGANAESADIWAVTQRDQLQVWIVVPTGVFLILWLALRDFWTCVNLVATMVLTYLCALGATHLVFVTWWGAEGIDWKVPLFLFVLLVAVGVDYNIFLMSRLQREVKALGLRAGIKRAIAQTGGLISSAAAITACSFASFLTSPLASIRQLGFALVVGIVLDAVLVRPVLVPCGHWLLHRGREEWRKLRVRTRALKPHLAVND